MKKFFKSLLYTGLLVTAFTFIACQADGDDTPIVDNETNVAANSTTAQLIKRTVSNDGSFDNIIDGSSCFNIRFPYTVEVGGVEITVNSKEDLKLIEKIFDAIEDDSDLLDIIFPITVTLADFAEVTVNNIEELRELAANCIEGGGDEDIECVDIVYPVTMFTFNINSQQTGTVTVNSDREMRLFFAGLGEQDLVGIDFPIELEAFDGTKISINDYESLADTINRFKDVCDEDDDDDYNDDDFTKERLDSLLVECPWWVKDLRRDNIAQTAQYEAFKLEFATDGTVTASGPAGGVITGTWETQITDWRVVLTLAFEDLVDFNLTWFVYEIDESKIKLFKGDGNRIILESACDSGKECTDAEITSSLSECVWVVANGQGTFLEYLKWDFTNMNIHVRNPNETVVDEGNWSIDQGVLSFNDLSLEVANYIGEWTVISCAEDRFEIKRGEELLVFERNCD